MAPKLKTASIFAAVALASCLAIGQVGCLTPAQQAAQTSFVQALDKDTATLASLKAEVGKYRAELAAIAADVKAGRIPAASGLALADKIMANMEITLAKIGEVEASIAGTRKALADLKASGAPWYAYAGPIGLTLMQLLGTFVPQLSFLVPVAGALKGQLASTQTKLAVTTEVAGSLSRTLDALPKVEAEGLPKVPVLARAKEDLLVREQAADELATKADYDAIRALAKAGAI